jgi:serine/threonine-protein kinase
VQSTLDPRSTPVMPAPTTPGEAYFQQVLCGMLKKELDGRANDLGDLARHFGALSRSLRPQVVQLRMAPNKLRIAECDISFDVGDLAECSAEGIVNSAHDHMHMRSGCGDALRKRGGDAIEEEAMKGGVRSLGACLATKAGALDARWVLHAVSAWNEVSCVGRAAQRTFLLAENLGVRTLSVPALGTGASRVSHETCAAALATALRHHLSLGGSRLKRVQFVLRDQATRDRFRDVAIDALRDPEDSPTNHDLGLEVDCDPMPEAATHVRASEG